MGIWAHLLLWAHQSYSYQYLQKNHQEKRLDSTRNKESSTIEEETTARQVGISRISPMSKGWWPTNEKIIKIAEILPKEWGIWATHQTSPTWVSCARQMTPRTSHFEGQWGFTFRSPRSECVRTCSVMSDFLWPPWTVAHQAPLSM